MVSPLCIVDLSHHNPEPNWRQLKAAGIVGVILKATEGKTYIDDTFSPRREAARAAGLIVSSYHFLKHGSVPEQMSHYLDVVAPTVGERVVIDYEDAACRLDDLRIAVDRLRAQPLDLQITIYAGHLLKEQLGNDRDPLLADAALWIAQYNNTGPKWPTGTWPVWSLWQYTDRATVPGISKPVDGNKFNGSVANAAKWLAPAGAVEPVPVEAVKIDIAVPPGVEVDIKVNGEVWDVSTR